MAVFAFKSKLGTICGFGDACSHHSDTHTDRDMFPLAAENLAVILHPCSYTVVSAPR